METINAGISWVWNKAWEYPQISIAVIVTAVVCYWLFN